MIKLSYKQQIAFNSLSIIAGNALYALTVVLFLVPSGLITGGATGIALGVNRALGLPVSGVLFVINISMLVLGWIVLGRRFAITTIASTILSPMFLALWEHVVGDFVLTGGEIAAMAVADAVSRLIPGVLPDPECFEEESHWNGMLEYPQYSRPAVWHDLEVPPILRSGNHAEIAKWRRKQSILRTRERRPDLYAKLNLSAKEDQKLLRELEVEESEQM